MEHPEYQTLILAGLLHDIGQLLQYAPGGESAADFLQQPETAANLARLGVDVAQLVFALLPPGGAELPGDQAAANRQAPACVSLGARLAAGGQPESAPPGADPPTLRPIFANLYLGRPAAGQDLRYAPGVLRPEAAFPAAPADKAATVAAYTTLVQHFKAAWGYALTEARDVRQLEAWIYSLLERYAWAVPSRMNAREEPGEVSLFDHARTSCALAACTYLWRTLSPAADPAAPEFLFIKGDLSGVQDYIYTIANVGPGGVAKRLRARSFFLTALTEVISHRLLDELTPDYRLPLAAKIIAGGAQFVLVAPNLPAVRDNLARLNREINAWLWREFQGDLALVFGAEVAHPADLAVNSATGRTIADVLEALDKAVKAAKAQKLSVLLQTAAGWDEAAFKWEAQDYPYGDCPSCRKLPANAPELDETGAPVETDRRLCDRCAADRQLSEQLVKARYIAYYHGENPTAGLPDGDGLRRGTLQIFAGAAARYAVLVTDVGELARLPAAYYQLDGFGYEEPGTAGGAPLALVRHFANYVPRFESFTALQQFCTQANCVYQQYDDAACGILVRPDGSVSYTFPQVQTFGCLAAAAAEWDEGGQGSQLLGVLRADVDNLGLLFARGMASWHSLARLATLSRMTDLFFSGWVHHTLQTPPPGKAYDRIYTVYAGGDDLCLVGPWDVLIDFSRYLAEQFAGYVGHNPNVTLSAAIAVTKPKYPIATAARQAGSWLDHRAKDAGRNRLHLFGVTVQWCKLPEYDNSLDDALRAPLAELEARTPLTWDDLWPWAELLDGELRRWRLDKARGVRYPVSTGFAHRLLEYAERARYWEEEERISAADMLYLAHLAYDLGRNVVKSAAVPEETKRQLSRLTHLANRRVMAGLRLPITYALYRNRERSREA